MIPRIFHGDCIDAMRELPENSVDSIVTDPPYGLGFMGKEWDDLPPGKEWAAECLRVLKPGAHLLAFGGTRTWHRLAVAIEDAGFEIRDSIAWLYGSGFPKSLDVSKAIDKAAGATREVVGSYAVTRDLARNGRTGDEAISPVAVVGTTVDLTAPATPEAEQWQGWGTALKPAHEPICVARKPIRGTVAANVQEYGVGALNIDGCRIDATDEAKFPAGIVSKTEAVYGSGAGMYADRPRPVDNNPAGRWPANVILDESSAAALDEQSGVTASKRIEKPSGPTPNAATWEGGPLNGGRPARGFTDTGGASRFFYCAKAPKKERPVVNGKSHSTVKPLTLMRYLIRLVTPPGGVVLDTFGGSGATAEAAMLEGFGCIIMEKEDTEEHPYMQMILQRILRQSPSRV
jgi:site-specific DNA-methyltransferase (adenine-specific)